MAQPTPPRSREPSAIDLKAIVSGDVEEAHGEHLSIHNTPMSQTGHLSHEDHVHQEPTPPHTRAQSPARFAPAKPHLQFVRSSFERFTRLEAGEVCVIDGQSLRIPDVVAVAK